MRVCISRAHKKIGNVFVPMHWTEQTASFSRMGALVNPVVDPISKQPECKHTPVRIEAFKPVWQGFIISRHALPPLTEDYWVKIKGEDYYRYELAGNTAVSDWSAWLKQRVNAPNQSWQEYQDVATGLYRAAQFHEGDVMTIAFISERGQLPERAWLCSLFSKTHTTQEERRGLLTGKPPKDTPDTGAVICACFNVGEKTIRQAIKDLGLKSHLDVGQCLKAGTNCGSCISEIKDLLAGVE
ncbi:(2Fe-2S)-binding protein [Methylocucumis oryzae]|uniref:(2Fe-2S)-binding protein n=1 Tax=Methylocucumis oryzae TaxID=1632867 RepID=UPI00308460F4